MSLESKIDALIKAVEANTAAVIASGVHIQGQVLHAEPCVQTNAQAVVAVTQAAMTTPVVTQAEVAALAAPAVQMPAVQMPAVQMPATPTFTPPAAAPVTGIPFNDAASVMAYTVGKYNSLGKDKGMKISDVLTNLGVATLTDLKPEHYPHYYAGVEAIQ